MYITGMFKHNTFPEIAIFQKIVLNKSCRFEVLQIYVLRLKKNLGSISEKKLQETKEKTPQQNSTC